MSAQTSPSRTWTPPLERGRRRAAPERPANRAVGAAIVAGGPALIVLLYPLPDGPRLLDPFQPEQESSSKSAKVVESTFLKVGADLGICRGSGVDSNRSPKFGASRPSSLGIRCGSVFGTCRTHGFSICRTRGSGTCRTRGPATCRTHCSGSYRGPCLGACRSSGFRTGSAQRYCARPGSAAVGSSVLVNGCGLYKGLRWWFRWGIPRR
jgi:hypothetical protein